MSAELSEMEEIKRRLTEMDTIDNAYSSRQLEAEEIAERAAGDERAPNAPVRRYLAAALKDARPLGRLGSALVSGQLLVCVLAAHEQRAAIADGSDMQPRAAQQYGLRDEP